MPRWAIYAVLSAVFAGLTSVLAKGGMKDISADLGLAIRTAVVLVLVLFNVAAWRGGHDLSALTARQWALLVLSGAATTLSWICYYRAMKEGPVSYVAVIDKGSILVTLALSLCFLGEQWSVKLLAGTALVAAGLVVLAVR